MTVTTDDLRNFGAFFADYDNEELRDMVIPHLSELVFAAGDVICRERAPGNSCFFLVEGEVGVETQVASGRSEQIGQLSAGTIFGQLVLLDGGTRSATCLAITDCRILELNRSDFDAMRARGSRLALDLQLEIARALARQIRQATDNLSAMSETRVEDPIALSQRLESFLHGAAQDEEDEANDDAPPGKGLKLRDIEL